MRTPHDKRRVTGLTFGSVLLVAIVATAIVAPLLTTDPFAQDLTARMIPPAWADGGSNAHALGTDTLGRDYLARLVYGARISLLIAAAVTLVSGVIGTSLGLAAGYFGGRIDLAVSFFVSLRLAIPVILVVLGVVAAVGGSLVAIVLVLALFQWDRFAVVIRAAAQQARACDYVLAARAAGGGGAYVLLREILPNVAPHLLVIATVEAANAVLMEAALSFLGLGVQPPLPSWGLMIAEAKDWMFFAFWMIAIPGSALGLLVLSINLIGDGLRDHLVPEGR